jgi:integrase
LASHGYLTENNLESKEGRTVYLDDELKEIFNNQWEARKTSKKLIPYVFPGKDSKDRIKDFRFAWEKACKNVRIGKKLFHDFRRSAVRNMVRSGIPEKVVMMISGHKTRSVFERYNIVKGEDLKEATKKQEAYLKTQMETAGTITGTIHDFNKKRGNHENG